LKSHKRQFFSLEGALFQGCKRDPSLIDKLIITWPCDIIISHAIEYFLKRHFLRLLEDTLEGILICDLPNLSLSNWLALYMVVTKQQNCKSNLYKENYIN